MTESFMIDFEKGTTSTGKKFDPKLLIPDLINYIDRLTKIEHIIYMKKIYKERSNFWQKNNCETRESYDKDKECDETDCSADIHPNNPDKVKYIISTKTQEFSDFEESDFKYYEILNEINNNVKRNGLNFVILKGFDEILLINKSGINHDHRGSNHCKVELVYYSHFKINNKDTLEDFANAFYRVKSHKWDKYYEMYHLSSVTKTSNNNYYFVDVEFDHGS